jgi:hypothetical protein
MRFTVSGQPYEFRAGAAKRSAVLARCNDEPSSENDSVTDIPLTLEWVQAWDDETPLEQLDQEALLGVVKECADRQIRLGKHLVAAESRSVELAIQSEPLWLLPHGKTVCHVQRRARFQYS